MRARLLAGVLLGPTILGRFLPAVHGTIFPAAGTPSAITLGGIEQLAVGLFLFVAGMEVSLAAVRREGGRALAVSFGGLLVPFGLGLAVAMGAPQLVGAVGVSGDGIDQDDIVAASGASAFPAPLEIRADRFSYRGARLPYAKFPRNPAL